MEYKVVVVDGHGAEYRLEDPLNEGWTLERATPVDRSVHYVLSRAKTVTEEKPKEAKQDTAEDNSVDPINLDDIPF